MKSFRYWLLTAVALTPVGAWEAQASVVQSVGSGSAVTSVDRSATFDSITTNGIDLASYAEGLLSITVPDISFVGSSFNPFLDFTSTRLHYGDGGNTDFVTLRGTDSAVFSGLEMKVGLGLGGPDTRVSWETYLTGSLTGFGTFTVAKGTIAGWADDMTGFDELRVIGDDGSLINPSLDFGDFQAIALDDVDVQLRSAGVIPEPTTSVVWLLLGCIGITFSTWRRRRREV